MMDIKKTFGSLIVIVIVGALAYAVWVAAMKVRPQASLPGTVCTLDAQQCPDGSWVGRSGPNCEFVCPTPVSTSTADVTIVTSLNHKVIALDVGITPLEVLEDSRCPQNVQCIQAGTVKLRVKLESGLGVSESTIELNKTITTEAETVTLVSAEPQKEAGKTIASERYTFTFRVSKR